MEPMLSLPKCAVCLDTYTPGHTHRAELALVDVERDSGRAEAVRALCWLVSPIPGFGARRRHGRLFIFGGPLVWAIYAAFLIFAFCFVALYVAAVMAVRVAVVLAALIGWGVLSGVGVIHRRDGHNGQPGTSSEAQRPTATGERPGHSH